ncbi:MAG: MFS transporter [Oscillospiraceae bacterium]|jgi:MFS family permease|nr:MFS transporter [Oscillospiraceae bacterium]
MKTEAQKLKKNVLLALVIFGLFGQVAWTIENMYFNVFLYKTVTYDPGAAALMVAASAITATLTTLLMGALSDKLGRRKIFIVAGYLIWGLVIMSFALVSKEGTAKLFPGADVIGATVAIVVFLDCLMTFFGSAANDAAFNAWVTDVTVPENRGKAEGILSALPLLAMLIVFGGFDGMTRSGRWPAFFLIIGGMVILGGFAGLFIIKDNKSLRAVEGNYFKNIFYGFRPSVIKGNTPLYIILIALGVFCTAQQVFMPYLIIYIEYYLGIQNYAVVLAVVLLLAAASSVIMGRQVDKFGKQKFLYLSAAIFTAGLFVMYAHGKLLKDNMTMSLIFLGVFGTLMMGGSLLLSLIINAAARDYMPPEQRGHYNGIRMIFYVLIPMVIGPFIGSAIIKNGPTYLDEFGAEQFVPNPEIFLGAAVVSLLVFIPLFFIIKNMKKGTAAK